MRKSPLALLLSLICLISSHNEIQAQGHPPTDSLRQRAAASVGKEKHDLLMRIAMSTNDIADWDATLNDAIDRYDTPAICQSRLNRIQCLFNFYSVDSAIIEAQESLPFILDAKQYSFYFSTYNTYISGLFKQRRFDEAREEATTMFETAQQVKQPVGMTMALQVQGSMYYKLGLYDQALTSLENWRKFFYQKYSAVLDSLYKGNDMMVAADSLIRFVKRESGYVYSDELSLPHLGALFLQKNCVGYCRESCDLSVYVLRSVGIPVATDFIISAPEAQGGHSWNVIKDGTGIIPFEYDEGKVTQGYDDKRLKGKIYRQCFGKQKKDITGIMDKPEVPAVLKSPYIKDVTGEYFGENSVEVEIDETECGQYAYLGVFSFPGWKAIDMALHQNGKASMKNIEPDVIYVPLASNHNGSLFHTIGFPFWLTDKGLKYFQPEKEVETVELFRKYPLRKWTRFHISEIIGSHLDVSNSLDFRQSELLYMVADTPRVNYNQVICHPQKKYRYVRYQAAADKPARIAELMLFRSEEDTVNLPFKIINGSEPCKGNEKEVKENICDGNYLTYFLSDEKGGYVTLDLGKDEWIKKIVYVPRNDENFISMGHEYELFYQNGPDGWVSLGRKTATEPRLVYNNVPKNALLWLHNLSAGKEEQVFYMQNGQQIFLNKW